MSQEVEYDIIDNYDGTTPRTAYYRTTNRFLSHIKTGVSFGSCLAMVISYVNWNSVLWAIFHGLLGWIYVIYYLLRY